MRRSKRRGDPTRQVGERIVPRTIAEEGEAKLGFGFVRGGGD